MTESLFHSPEDHRIVRARALQIACQTFGEYRRQSLLSSSRFTKLSRMCMKMREIISVQIRWCEIGGRIRFPSQGHRALGSLN